MRPSFQPKLTLMLGFTLIELMIVVAIIGVLSAIAVPSYQNYVKKSEVTSAVAVMKSLVAPAELYYQERGNIVASTDLGDLGAAPNLTSLGTLSARSTNILALALNGMSGAEITITRDDQAGWLCSASGDAAGLVKSCL